MGAPQGDGERILLVGCKIVRDRGGGPMLQVTVAIEPPEPIHAAWQPHCQERRKGRCREQEEQADPNTNEAGADLIGD